MNDRQKGLIYTLLSALCFATGGILLKVNTWSSLSVSGFRSVFALVVFVVYMLVKRHPMKLNWQVFLGAIANTLMMVSFVMANRLTTAANAIILQFTMPVYIILLLWIFEKKRPQMSSVVAAGCSLIGICFFFFDSISTTGMVGNILALVSGLFYAVVFLIKRIPNSDFESSAVLSFAINIIIGIPFVMKETDFSAVNIWTGVLLGVVQIGVAYMFLNAALEKASPIAVALASMAEPIVNPVLVAVFYGETIGGASMIGAVIVLISALAYNLLAKD